MDYVKVGLPLQIIMGVAHRVARHALTSLYLRRPTGEDKLRLSSSQSAPPWLFTASKRPAAVLLLLELLVSAPSDGRGQTLHFFVAVRSALVVYGK